MRTQTKFTESGTFTEASIKLENTNTLLFSVLLLHVHLEPISNRNAEISFVYYYRCYSLTSLDGCILVVCNSKKQMGFTFSITKNRAIHVEEPTNKTFCQSKFENHIPDKKFQCFFNRYFHYNQQNLPLQVED